MRLIKYFEFTQHDLEPIKSFRIKDELNPKIWDNFNIDDEVREDLLKIAQDFYDSTKLETEVEDIVLTGSLSGYMWSEKYSDYDLHILIDFSKISDIVDLVKKYVDSARSIWNKEHDIKIKGYEVEIYIQDVNELHISSGIFSLLKNKWVKKPERIDFEPNEKLLEEKAKTIMMSVDDIEDQLEKDKYEDFHEKIKKIWEKVKNYRKSGLESQGGELSLGNLVFKFLRRNGYIGKIINLKRKSYDNQFK